VATYNLKYNKDDSVIRHIIIGLLADLNSKLSFKRQLSNDNRVIIDVPFFYSVSGDENFLKDAFLFSNANGIGCDPDGEYADGNYDKVPRGIVNLTSFAVDPSKLVNKRNLGNYNRINDEGFMEGFVAEFQMIPVVVGVDIEILVSSQLDLFKVTEALIKKMYKANFYHVDAGHIEDGTYRISSQYMMPDDYTQERPVEYGFDDKGNHKVTFSLEINSFLPDFNFEEDQIRKYTTDYFALGAIGDYVDPNGFISGVPIGHIYCDNGTGAKWEYNGTAWVQIGLCGDDENQTLGEKLETKEEVVNITRRRKQSNRMFTLGNSSINLEDKLTDQERTMLGDNYNVTGRDLPFEE
jgi:hypothetical protein